MKSRLIYADYAAATPADPQVIEAMQPYFSNIFGNPSSAHLFGKKAAEAIDTSRQIIAKFLNVEESEIYFTSSGTESNNVAILGIAKANKKYGQKIVTSMIEHPSVINTCRALEKDGFETSYIKVNTDGLIDESTFEKAVDATTVLVTLHLANSEIGVVQNISKLAKIAKQKNPHVLIHTDACQATPFLDLDIQKLGVDALTLNGSKAYGPKGIAILYIKNGVDIFPIMYGGGQERSLRSGTENVPGIVGLAKAVEVILSRRTHDTKNIGELRDVLQNQLSRIPGVKINCQNSSRLPNHLSITLTHTKETDLVAILSRQGIAISAGSACSSKSLTDSHVLQAIDLRSEEIHKTLRITLGRQTDRTTVAAIVRAIKGL